MGVKYFTVKSDQSNLCTFLQERSLINIHLPPTALIINIGISEKKPKEFVHDVCLNQFDKYTMNTSGAICISDIRHTKNSQMQSDISTPRITHSPPLVLITVEKNLLKMKKVFLKFEHYNDYSLLILRVFVSHLQPMALIIISHQINAIKRDFV